MLCALRSIKFQMWQAMSARDGSANESSITDGSQIMNAVCFCLRGPLTVARRSLAGHRLRDRSFPLLSLRPLPSVEIYTNTKVGIYTKVKIYIVKARNLYWQRPSGEISKTKRAPIEKGYQRWRKQKTRGRERRPG